MKRFTILAALALAVTPAAALAGGPSNDAQANASKQCTALRAKMGATAFAQAYASLGACVSRLQPLEQQNATSANTACQAEQADAGFAAAHGGKTFDAYYGSGKKGANAFGNCVSQKAQASSKAEQQASPNPAQTCKSLRTSMGATTFSQTYGKTANDRNAFGKCVSAQARAQASAQVTAAAACRTEQGDAATFASTYGSGDDAFGKCVSSKARSSVAAARQATVTAAQSCATELKAGASAFAAKYKTFGACVSQKATS